MSPELEADLKTRFPLLYRNLLGGFACGDGWHALLSRYSEPLELELRATVGRGDEGAERLGCYWLKEKWGTLQYNMVAMTTTQALLIHEIESQSAITCERCGAEGRLREGDWLRTLCDGCAGEG